MREDLHKKIQALYFRKNSAVPLLRTITSLRTRHDNADRELYRYFRRDSTHDTRRRHMFIPLHARHTCVNSRHTGDKEKDTFQRSRHRRPTWKRGRWHWAIRQVRHGASDGAVLILPNTGLRMRATTIRAVVIYKSIQRCGDRRRNGYKRYRYSRRERLELHRMTDKSLFNSCAMDEYGGI